MYNKDLWDIQRVAEKIGMAFELDSIYAYYLDENRREVLWGMKSNSPLDIEYFRSDSYMGNFDKSNTFVCDQTKFLEKRFDTAFNAFHEMKIFNCIQQCVGSLERPKVILSFNKNKESKKWTELDVTLLSILGNAIGVKLENDR